MERLTSPDEARRAIAEARREKTIALVPTMGALHEGHLALVRAARGRADYIAVSIFVNPTQFTEGEDFESYPRTMERDLDLLSAEGVDLAFTPTTEQMYERPTQVFVDPGELAELWEGRSREGHFRGVATVVAKLFNILQPDIAFFGEKDYQQLKVIERVVADLAMPVAIAAVPTVRDRDGVALSSRNAYLSRDERAQAVALCEALEAAAQAVAWGERDARTIERTMAEETSKFPLAVLDYAAVVDPETLRPLETVTGPARALIAARVGRTRLIDNAPLVPPAGTDEGETREGEGPALHERERAAPQD